MPTKQGTTCVALLAMPVSILELKKKDEERRERT
jgi:hypothetical protein